MYIKEPEKTKRALVRNTYDEIHLETHTWVASRRLTHAAGTRHVRCGLGCGFSDLVDFGLNVA